MHVKRLLHSRHFRGLAKGAALFAAVHLAGTLGYRYIGHPSASWIDSFYMTFITVATIGFGEVVDLSQHPWGRLFTVALALVGIVTMSYMFSMFLALLIESDLNAHWRMRRMQKQIDALEGQYIVCGVGRVGSNVAEELIKTNRRFVAIEPDAPALERWIEKHPGTPHLMADAADDDTLRRAGVMRAAGVFAVAGDDSHNLMIALSVKLLNPAVRVVVRLHDVRNVDKARRAGADEIVSPDFTGAMRITSAMVRPHAVNFMDQMLRSDEGLRVEEVLVPAGFAPRALADVVPPSRDYILMATHERGQWVFNPAGDHLVQPGATLVLMTSPQGREQLERVLGG